MRSVLGRINILLDALGYHKILKQCARVGALLHREKIANHGVADATVPKEYFAAVFQLIAEILAVSGQPENDICLLQKRDIFFHRL